jgi:hypothetical protein
MNIMKLLFAMLACKAGAIGKKTAAVGIGAAFVAAGILAVSVNMNTPAPEIIGAPILNYSSYDSKCFNDKAQLICENKNSSAQYNDTGVVTCHSIFGTNDSYVIPEYAFSDCIKK